MRCVIIGKLLSILCSLSKSRWPFLYSYDLIVSFLCIHNIDWILIVFSFVGRAERKNTSSSWSLIEKHNKKKLILHINYCVKATTSVISNILHLKDRPAKLSTCKQCFSYIGSINTHQTSCWICSSTQINKWSCIGIVSAYKSATAYNMSSQINI